MFDANDNMNDFSSGNSYPANKISGFIDDNKVNLNIVIRIYFIGENKIYQNIFIDHNKVT